MAVPEKQLAQTTPSGTSAVSAYSPASGITGTIARVVICNTTNSIAEFSLYIDDNGTTYNNTTAHYNDIRLKGKQTVELSTFWPMSNSAGNFAVKTSVSNALTFSIYGLEREQ